MRDAPTPTPHGLTAAEAARRLHVEGYNELPGTRSRSVWSIALGILREPMFLLLISAGLIYLLLGDVREALMLLFFVFVVVGITLYQESRTERVLEALRDLTSPRALVIRDGDKRRIAGREVVRGDILLLAEGDRVAADAVLLSANTLQTDESLLTGDSLPVRKRAGTAAGAPARPGGDDLPFVYSGSLVVQGQGIAEVIATGARSEIGKIGKALQQLEEQPSPLQREIRRLVRNLAVVGLILCALLVALYGSTRGDWLGGLLAGITLAMATLPEEFPVVLTVFMALGAWRISRQQVLTRRVPAIETLGAATVLCVDKTGTLTQNRMAVRRLYAEGETFTVDDDAAALPERFHPLVEFSVLASEADPFDPMEKAFKALAERYLAGTEHLHHDWTLAHEYSLSPEMLAMSHAWKARGREEYVIAAKGAPEAVIDLCHLDETQRTVLARAIADMADAGLRVLAVACAGYRGPTWPALQHDFEFKLLGLLGLADPLRPTAPQAVAECREAGIRVVMITGDYPGTARAIAEQAGLGPVDAIVTGDALARLNDDELQQRIGAVNVFARIVPEQKLRLVNAFKARGDIVAMTGDGVNDAPALKAAHIGVAMGERGTDVAREAAALVLLNDDFSSIVHAVRLGRRIYDNLRNAMNYTLAIHIPIAGLALLPLMFGLPQLFWPAHIVFLQLIIDPACSIVFEAEREEANVMKRPPRPARAALFSGRTLGISLLQGTVALLVVLAVFAGALAQGRGEAEARAMAFTTLVIANLALIFTNRSWSRNVLVNLLSPNTALWWVTGATLTFLALVLCLPWLRALFHFGALGLRDVAICVAAGLATIAWFEIVKLIRSRARRDG